MTQASENNDDIESVSIHIPCQPSEYVHALCFQFIQILLVITAQPHVPQSMVSVLEHQFRQSTSTELHRVFLSFLRAHRGDEALSESLGLQFYFDVSFAAAILSTKKKEEETQSLWDEVLRLIETDFIELVTIEYADKYLQREIRKAVHATLLMYGGGHSSTTMVIEEEEEKRDMQSGGGHIFGRPKNKMPRIALLPVASYQISQSVLDEEDHALRGTGHATSGLLSAAKLHKETDSKAVIAQSLNELKSGATNASIEGRTVTDWLPVADYKTLFANFNTDL